MPGCSKKEMGEQIDTGAAAAAAAVEEVDCVSGSEALWLYVTVHRQ